MQHRNPLKKKTISNASSIGKWCHFPRNQVQHEYQIPAVTARLSIDSENSVAGTVDALTIARFAACGARIARLRSAGESVTRRSVAAWWRRMANAVCIACCCLARRPRYTVTAEVGSSTCRRLSFPVLPPFPVRFPGATARGSSGAVFRVRACSKPGSSSSWHSFSGCSALIAAGVST